VTEKGNLMEGAAALQPMTTAAENPAHRQAFMDTMRYIVSDVSPGDRPRSPSLAEFSFLCAGTRAH